MEQLQTVLDRRVFADLLENLLHRLKTHLGILFVPICILVKNDLIMGHVIEHLKKHDVTQFPGFKVHNIIVDDFYLIVFKECGVLS